MKKLYPISVAVLLAASVAQGQEKIQESGFVPTGYEKVFSDEMNGTSLDTTKWWTRYIYEDGKLATLNDEEQLFAENNNHVMTGGTLQLTARIHPEPGKPRFKYQSGMIRSKETFKYGYYEARVRAPAGLGAWPCFWLNADSDANGKAEWPPEIDIFEFVNNGKDDTANMLHMGVVMKPKPGETNPWDGTRLFTADNVKPRKGEGGAILHADKPLPDTFHTTAVLWDTDDTVTFFLDGKKLASFKYKWVHKDGREAPNAHILLNLSFGGKWAGRYGVDQTAFPQNFEIDYVRVYQKQGQTRIGKSTIGHDFLKAQPTPTAASSASAAAPKSAPTPYPDAKDTAAWPGKGPIRVFPWMKDNRAFFWTRRTKDQNAIVFVGDSLTGNWKDLSAAFPNHKVANRGIGGDVSRGVFFRLQEDVLDLKPRAVVLLIGTNDLSAGSSPTDIADNVRSILTDMQASRADLPIILCTVPPRDSEKSPIKPGQVEALNAQLKTIASEKKVTLLDLHAALKTEDGKPQAELFDKDRLHFGAGAYAKWKELITPLLPASPK